MAPLMERQHHTARDHGGLAEHTHGPVTIDWPRATGYFSGVGLALALGVIDAPLALFVAAVPFVKLLNRAHAPAPARLLSQFYEGMAKPVGGDGAGALWISRPERIPPALRPALQQRRPGRQTRAVPPSRRRARSTSSRSQP